MAMVSIDLEQMAALVTALENASTNVTDNAARTRTSLTTVHLSTESLTPVDGVEAWIDEQLPGVRRRLAMAQALEAETPGIQLYVQFDESDISTATPEEARERADRAAELMGEYHQDIPDELVDLLEANANDPYFARQLALKVSPEDAADVIRGFSSVIANRHQITTQDTEYSKQFDAKYERLLSSMGQTFGLATRNGGDLKLPDDYSQRWADAIVGPLDPANPAYNKNGQPGALGLIISRGHWSTDFLTTVTERIYSEEVNRDQRGMWQRQATSPGSGMITGVVEPGGRAYFDPLAGVLTAVGRNPEAGHHLFGSGQLIEIEFEGQKTEVNEFLEYLIARRRWPADDGAGAQAAIATAMTPFQGGDTVSADIAADARAIVTAKAEEIEARGDDRNWFSDIGHLVLDGLGLIPVVGEGADGINAVWYAAEGDVVNAAMSSAAMAPFVGWVATGGKWTRRGLNAADLARGATKLDGTPLDPSAAGNLLARADNVAPGVFEFSSLRAFNRAANNPHPGVTYRYKDMNWTTDDLGRITSVQGKPRLESGGRNSKTTGKIGNEGRDTDVGFHLLADSLGGPTNRLNVVPGNGKPIDDGLANLNQGEYARMERQLRQALGDGKNVEIEIVPGYKPGNTTTRPDDFTVWANIDGKPIEFNFVNK